MPELTHSIETKSEIVVTKGIAYTEFLLDTYSNFEFVFSPRICYNFPIMTTIHKRSVTYHCPEQIISFKKESVPTILTKMDFFRTI